MDAAVTREPDRAVIRRRSEIEELELVRGQRGPERLDLVEAVE